MFLNQKDESDFSAVELKILEMMELQSIEYFPILKAIALQESEENAEDISVTVSEIFLLCYVLIVL